MKSTINASAEVSCNRVWNVVEVRGTRPDIRYERDAFGGTAWMVDVKGTAPPQRNEWESLGLKTLSLRLIASEHDVVTTQSQFLRDANGWRRIATTIPGHNAKRAIAAASMLDTPSKSAQTISRTRTMRDHIAREFPPTV